MRDFGASGCEEVSFGGCARRWQIGTVDCACAEDGDSARGDVWQARQEVDAGAAGGNRDEESSGGCERFEACRRELQTACGGHGFSYRVGAGAADDRATRDARAEIDVSWSSARGNVAHRSKGDQFGGL